MAYTVEQCEAILADLQTASAQLAAETVTEATVNSVEYKRKDMGAITQAIKDWNVELVLAKQAAGDFSDRSVRWVG